MENIELPKGIEQIGMVQWEALATSSANASFFQTASCYQFYASLSFLKPFVYGVSEHGRLVGLVCGYVIAEGNPIKQFFSKRAIVPGGVLIDENITEVALESLLGFVRKQLSRKAIYIEIRNYSDYSVHKQVFAKAGYTYQAHLNFHVATPDVDTALKNLSTTKRRDIKLSKKEGAEWFETSEKDDIKAYYELLKNLYTTKIKLPLFSFLFFETLIEQGYGKLLVVKYEGQLIGGSVCVLSPKLAVFEWFVCGLDGKFKNVFPSTLATWAGIEYAAQHGYERFDMMGAGKPDDGYGVRDFKSKFGGKLVEHGRFLVVNFSSLYYIGEQFIKITTTKFKHSNKIVSPKIRFETEFSKIDKEKWRAFVFNHPNGNVFQTPKMFELYVQTPKLIPSIILSIDSKGEIIGCLLSVIQKEYDGLFGQLTVRSVIMGGPLVENNDITVAALMIQEYHKIIKGKAIYSQFRNLFDIIHLHPVFERLNYKSEAHLDTLIDLTLSVEELWNNLHKERRRNVSIAEKSGLVFKVLSVDNQIDELVQLLKVTYKRIRVPLSDEQLFTNAKKVLSDKVVYFGAYDGEKMVAGQIRLCYKGSVYAWFAGSDANYFSKRPNDFLTWKVLLWAKESEYKVFDFGGAGRPGMLYGVRDYKLKYGGSIVDYGRYEKVHNPLLMCVGKFGYKLYQQSNW